MHVQVLIFTSVVRLSKTFIMLEKKYDVADLMIPCLLLHALQFLEPSPYFLGRLNQMFS